MGTNNNDSTMTMLKKNYFFLFAILLQNPAVYGLLDEIQETLGNSLSYLKKGLAIVKNVEEFIDNTIGEDCEFECRPGYEAIPNLNHQSTTNGCGSLDLIFDDSEESFIHVEQEFTQVGIQKLRHLHLKYANHVGIVHPLTYIDFKCCDVHDYCYDTCGADKDECDLKFKKCLYSTCKKKTRQGYFDTKKCRLKAKLFYITVLGVGCQSYINAQKEACQCLKAEL